LPSRSLCCLLRRFSPLPPVVGKDHWGGVPRTRSTTLSLVFTAMTQRGGLFPEVFQIALAELDVLAPRESEPCFIERWDDPAGNARRCMLHARRQGRRAWSVLTRSRTRQKACRLLLGLGPCEFPPPARQRRDRSRLVTGRRSSREPSAMRLSPGVAERAVNPIGRQRRGGWSSISVRRAIRTAQDPTGRGMKSLA
jgi:hypothetical protein